MDFLFKTLQGFPDTLSDLRKPACSENDQNDDQNNDQF